MNKTLFLFQTIFTTPLGDMRATADTTALYTLEFIDNPKPFTHKQYTVAPESSPVFELLQKELTAYFAGTLTLFTVPLHLQGTPFQQTTWQQLCTIPYGTTISYAQLAQSINKPTAYRAVANANGANRIALIIPCHRVIASDKSLGGYRYLVTRKKFLLDHEKAHAH